MNVAGQVRLDLATPLDYPEGSYRGRGIVMCAGGYRLLANAFVSVRRIRRLSQLPVELFYAGDEELPPPVRARLESDFPGLACRDICSCQDLLPAKVRDFRGFHMKPFAILQASFREVLWLDADNLPLHDLDCVFAGEGYRRSGAQFWPDKGEARWTQDSLFQACGLDPPEDRQEFESGQIVLDKQRCWQALVTTCLLNSDHLRPYVYGLTNGDKDTFRLAFLMTATDYALVSHAPLRFGAPYLTANIALTGNSLQIGHPLGRFKVAGLLQLGEDQRPWFAHRTILEWNPYHESKSMTHVDWGQQGTPCDWLAQLEAQGQRDLDDFRRRYQNEFPVEWWPRCQRPLLAMILPILDLLLALRRWLISD